MTGSSGKSVRNLIRQFLLETSMHGLKYLGQEHRTRFERILWVFMFSFGVGVSVYLCCGLLNKFYSSPAVMSIESADEPLGNFLFPSVTICNQNKISKKKVMALMDNPRYNQAFDLNQMVLLMRVTVKIDAAFGREDELINISEIMTKNGITVEEVLNTTFMSMVDCDQMLIDCQWKKRHVPCSQLFVKRLTDDGICCGFNPIESEWKFGEIGLPETRTTEHLSIYGHSVGLKLILDAQLDDYISTTGRSNGFKVLIHSPLEYPEVGERGFLVSPGFEVNAGLTPMTSYATDEVNLLPVNQRGCYLETENVLQFYANYSVSRCLVECLTRAMLEQCSCRPYYYPGDPSGKDIHCDLGRYVCLNDAFNRIRGDTHTFEMCSGCYPACDTYWHFNEMSMASFPGTLFFDSPLGRRIAALKANMSRPDLNQYLKRNGVLFNVFYKETTGYVYRKDVRFGVGDFISAMGGLLELGFGCSVISVIELFVHFILGIVTRSFSRHD